MFRVKRYIRSAVILVMILCISLGSIETVYALPGMEMIMYGMWEAAYMSSILVGMGVTAANPNDLMDYSKKVWDQMDYDTRMKAWNDAAPLREAAKANYVESPIFNKKVQKYIAGEVGFAEAVVDCLKIAVDVYVVNSVKNIVSTYFPEAVTGTGVLTTTVTETVTGTTPRLYDIDLSKLYSGPDYASNPIHFRTGMPVLKASEIPGTIPNMYHDIWVKSLPYEDSKVWLAYGESSWLTYTRVSINNAIHRYRVQCVSTDIWLNVSNNYYGADSITRDLDTTYNNLSSLIYPRMFFWSPYTASGGENFFRVYFGFIYPRYISTDGEIVYNTFTSTWNPPYCVGYIPINYPISYSLNLDTKYFPKTAVAAGSNVTVDVPLGWPTDYQKPGVSPLDYPWIQPKDIALTVDGVLAEDLTDVNNPPIVPPPNFPDIPIRGMSGLTEKFPFSIPFDLVKAFTMMMAPSEAPKFTIPFRIESLNFDHDFEIDLTGFEVLAKIVRWGILVGFNIWLILKTRELIMS